MRTTPVVRLMTPTYRVKDPADADFLPRSFEARSPQGTGPFAFRRRGCLDAAAHFAQRPLFHNSHRARADHIGAALKNRQAPRLVSAALPHLGCAHAQASTGSVCMCARAAACRVQRRIPGLRRPVASRVDTAEMVLSKPRQLNGVERRSLKLEAEAGHRVRLRAACACRRAFALRTRGLQGGRSNRPRGAKWLALPPMQARQLMGA
jgi:hypothetical protein